ncbi:MAG: SprT-like domain-containing protein [Candidatus Dormibacteria bacterium]
MLIGNMPSVYKSPADGRSPELMGEYDAFNVMYFSAKLPRVDVQVSNEKNSEWMGRTDECGSRCFLITISSPWNPSPREQSFTLLHEMCHVKMAVENINEFNMHGPKWQECMLELANKGAFNQLW